MSGGRLLFEARADGKHPILLSCHVDITTPSLTYTSVILSRGWSCPQGRLGRVWGHLWSSRLGRVCVLLASRGWGPGMLFNTHRAQDGPTEDDPMSTVLSGDAIMCE